MNTRTFIISLLLAATSSVFGAPPVPTQPTVDAERLVRVYVLLKNAEQMATGGVALSKDDLTTAGRALSADALKKECAASVDRSITALSSSPTNRRPETLAYMKNAMLRLTLDREEDHKGHVDWAGAHRDKVAAAIRECAKTIKTALDK